MRQERQNRNLDKRMENKPFRDQLAGHSQEFQDQRGLGPSSDYRQQDHRSERWDSRANYDRQDQRSSFRQQDADRAFQERHDDDADSELRFQARHRAPYETYSPYTDEDYGSNARMNNADPHHSDWDDHSSRPQASLGSSYRYDQNSDGMSGGSITFGRRSGGPMDLSRSSTEADSTSSSSADRYRGVGPKGYVRSDERIHEEVCEMLMHHSSIDASGVECVVKEGEVTLTGIVPERRMKFLAEEVAAHCHGVKDIHNRLKVAANEQMDSAADLASTKSEKIDKKNPIDSDKH